MSETTNHISPRGKRFSWHRFCNVAAYYYPLLLEPTILFLLISLVGSMMVIIPFPKPLQLSSFTLVWLVVPYIFYFAPLALTRRGDSLRVDRMLPAEAGEICLFYFLYFFILMPIITFGSLRLSLFIYNLMPASFHSEVMDYLSGIYMSVSGSVNIANIVTGLAMITTCLYIVIHCHSGRVARCIIAVIFINLYSAFTGMLIGFLDNSKENITQPQDAINLVANNNTVMIPSNIILAIFVCFMAYGIYKDIKMRRA
ncbi:MAG: hypothetical protein ACI304_04630 [Lepagella sp.]